ncbi:MAG: hypothetical protein WAW37_01990 [Syntrophobacteraceae bacterium]
MMPARSLRVFVLLVCLASIFQPETALPFKNEPESFRGIPFGADIGSIKKMTVIHKKDQLSLCERPDERLTMEEAAIRKITYVFQRNKFTSVMVEFESLPNFNKIKAFAFKQYGPGAKQDRAIEQYDWMGKNVGVSLEFNPATGKGALFYSCYSYGQVSQKK